MRGWRLVGLAGVVGVAVAAVAAARRFGSPRHTGPGGAGERAPRRFLRLAPEHGDGAPSSNGHRTRRSETR